MKISILSAFPELYDCFTQTSLVKKAQDKKIINIDVDNFFSFTQPKERIDAHTAGPGTGMLIKPELVEKAISAHEKQKGTAFKIFFSPQGKKLNQKRLRELATKVAQTNHVMLIPARYEGMDARVEEEYADEVISIGDYVLMGGDLPAMVLLEGLLRLIPGVIGKQASVEDESFTGPFVDYPEYALPVEWKGKKIPEIVQSGHHEKINEWRLAQAAQKTVLQHFGWLRSHELTKKQKDLARGYIPAHYTALMHTDVLVGKKEIVPGNTSVTSIDIHDIARSSKTYGVKSFFIVTPLLDQQRIVQTFLEFWQKGHGKAYNQNRFEAVNQVELTDNFEKTIAKIKKIEGKKPLVIATSARKVPGAHNITYFDQEVVWKEQRPILLLFGTGQGLSEELMKKVDFVLGPIEGFTDFNHLSVRSAVAIILDRWLGLNKEPA